MTTLACCWESVRPFWACQPGQVVTWIQLQSRGAISGARRPPKLPARAHYCICAVALLLRNTAVCLVKLARTLSLGETITAPFRVLRERVQGFIERGKGLLRMILIIKHIQRSLCLTVRVCVYWILFALCSECPCGCVFMCVFVRSRRPCSAVWSGVQMAELGPAEWDTLSVSLSVLLSFPLPFFSPSFLPSQAFSAGFHLPVTSLAASSLSSLHLLRAILGRRVFPPLYFLSPPLFFMRLSGLGAAARRGGFGMKCLLTEPCAPELR